MKNILVFCLLLFPSKFLFAEENTFYSKIKGVWECKKGKEENIVLLEYESDRIRLYENGLQFFRAIYTKDKVWLFLNTTPFSWEIKFINNDQFEMGGKDGKDIFTRSQCAHQKLEVPNVILGDSKVSDFDKNKILQELASRYKMDQEVRTNKNLATKMHDTDTSNTKYLKNIIFKYGWIDTSRFGVNASSTAFLIVQHSGDASLMTAALPQIEKDVKAKKVDGQDYALLYDRLMLFMGKKQKYGSQVVGGSNSMIILPCENQEKVEQFRNELGILSLAQYLKMFGQSSNVKPVFYEDKVPNEKE